MKFQCEPVASALSDLKRITQLRTLGSWPKKSKLSNTFLIREVSTNKYYFMKNNLIFIKRSYITISFIELNKLVARYRGINTRLKYRSLTFYLKIFLFQKMNPRRIFSMSLISIHRTRWDTLKIIRFFPDAILLFPSLCVRAYL